MNETNQTPNQEASKEQEQNKEQNQTPNQEASKETNQNTATAYTQEQLNAEVEKTRKAIELETKKKILAQLGLKPEDEEKLATVKQTYESTLSDTEKLNNTNALLQADLGTFKQQVEEKDYYITAMSQMAQLDVANIQKIVNMAKGLKTENNTIEDAIKEVVGMLNIQTGASANKPTGEPLEQGNTSSTNEPNPWKKETEDVIRQTELFRKDPAMARKLAAAAGISLY